MEPSSLKNLLERGNEAMEHADWQQAIALFTEALKAQEAPEIFEKLGQAAWWQNAPDISFDAFEHAYQGYVAKADRSGSARVAIWVARARIEFRGEYAVANGWLQRARSHLEGMDKTRELGWLSLFEGHLALMGKKDTTSSRKLAQESIELGKGFHDTDIEMWGRALDGLALVIAGDVPAGMQQLDEASAIGIGREAKDLNAIAATCCYLIHACERVQDHERATQWYARTRELCERWRFNALVAVCRAQYSSILMSRGNWPEAEAELLSARSELEIYRPSLIPFCDLRIGELRRRQGKLAEAQELFSQVESHPLSQLGRGLMTLENGDFVSALDLAQRYLRRVPESDRIERVPGLELQIRSQIGQDLLQEAGVTAGELLRIAQSIPIAPIRGSAAFGAGLLSSAQDELETARQQFEDAVDHYNEVGMPYDEARARLELAIVLQELDRLQPSQTEAQQALTTFEKLGAALEQRRCLAFLTRLLKDTTPLLQEMFRKTGMTRRESEVLALIATGKTNKEIAAQLFLSIRTVERHISNIYQKIGVSGKAARASATSFALKSGLS
ncbi:MAG: hypothetical protein HY562_10050 [Ignavibacteriales bacterium]|nr:hypothetical protein [Ignavibacteriales bacterium]